MSLTVIIGTVLAAVKTAVTVVTAALPKIGAAVMNLVNKIPQELWKPLIDLTTNVVKTLLGIKDSAGEIGEKARIAAEQGVKPEQFKSTSDYLKHLQEEIKIDRDKFDNLKPEELRARELTGTAIFIKAIEEKCGLKLSSEVLKTLAKIAMPAGQFLYLAEKLKNSELTFDDVVKYLDETCPSSKIGEVGELLKGLAQTVLGENCTSDAINQWIMNLIDKNKNPEATEA